MNYKIDLHTHSTQSHDGGLKPEHYRRILSENILDYIAITDHNDIEMARRMNRELGDQIIIGEEIMTNEGEIIGLYLSEIVPAGLSALETISRIKQQNGVVYIPHPFETIRKGIHPSNLEKLARIVDIIEICNGRAFTQNRSEQAVIWAKLNHKPGAASSDAHGFHGIGKTYTVVQQEPNSENLASLISNAIPYTERPKLRSLLYPKYNKLRKKVGKNV